MKKFFCAFILIFSFNTFAQKNISFDQLFPDNEQNLIIKTLVILKELAELNQSNFFKCDNLTFYYLLKLNSLINLLIKSQKNILVCDLMYISKTLKNIDNFYQKSKNCSQVNKFLFHKINNKLKLFTIHNLFLCQNQQ